MPISRKLNNGKAIRFPSKQGHLQPHFHSKTRRKRREGLDRSLLCNAGKVQKGGFEIVFHAATTRHIEMKMNPEENGK